MCQVEGANTSSLTVSVSTFCVLTFFFRMVQLSPPGLGSSYPWPRPFFSIAYSSSTNTVWLQNSLVLIRMIPFSYFIHNIILRWRLKLVLRKECPPFSNPALPSFCHRTPHPHPVSVLVHWKLMTAIARKGVGTVWD